MNAIVLAQKASEWNRLKALVLDGVSSPIAQAETLRSDTACQDGPRQRMGATYPRHETGEAPN